MRSVTTPSRRPRGNTMRSLLLFLIGVLVGANAVYFLLVRNQDCSRCAQPAAPPDVAGIGMAPSPVPPPDTAVDLDATDMRPTAAAPAPTGRLDIARQPEPAIRPRVPSPDKVDAPATATDAAALTTPAAPSGLLLPVAGIAAAGLYDTFEDRRGSERIHEALDIMAPAGTPVLATTDGRIEKLFDSDNGGLTIYQFDPTGTWCYYYAHLQRYAPGLEQGQQVKRGDVIGYVGSTGNASPDAPHLHFAIFLLGPEDRWWQGTPINPYRLLGGT